MPPFPDPPPAEGGALIDVVYDDLRREARRQLQSKPFHTLQPTALVNEALVRMLSTRHGVLINEAQLYTYVSKAMRSVLVDHARAKGSLKRGGGAKPVPMDEIEEPIYTKDRDHASDILAANEALDRLSQEHPQLAELAELRFFGRLSIPEVAAAKQVSEGRVKTAALYFRRYLRGA